MEQQLQRNPSLEGKRSSTPTQEQEGDTNTKRSYSPLVSALPPNAVVFQQNDRDASFHQYIENNHDPVLQHRLSLTTTDGASNKASESTLRDEQQQQSPTSDDGGNLTNFWKALAQDLEAKTAAKKKWYEGYDYNATEHQFNTTPAPWWVARSDQDGFASVGALLFLFGFICPPLWWIGSFWPRRPREYGGKMAERWQKLSRIMSIGFSVILILAIIIAVAIWKSS